MMVSRPARVLHLTMLISPRTYQGQGVPLQQFTPVQQLNANSPQLASQQGRMQGQHELSLIVFKS
jgi:hypothetical protein